jgi:hypothetical protein
MADRFSDRQSSGLADPATRHYTITPANSDLAIRPRALFVKVAGDLVIRDELGTDQTYPVNVGDVIPFRAVQIRTGTTATVIGWD